MYIYDEYDQQIVEDRVKQFRDQTRRFLAGELSESEFLPLRLQNGLYVQRYAPMLRVAIPYGLISARQVRKLAFIARTYDKGYVHFSTRQNVQFNWPALAECPQILADLAEVQMHAVQTSGNCIRNTTTDEYAGVIAEEITDPRPYCEIIRQWSTFHPEFAFLPRKFKIAVNAVPGADRAAIQIHDIGVNIVRNEAGELGYRILVGGGLGRTPVIGTEIRAFLPEEDLLTYLDAVIRVYNQFGRRDNKYKARIKILTKALGIDRMRELVEAEWERIRDGEGKLTRAELDRVKKHFSEPAYKDLQDEPAELTSARSENPAFARWQRDIAAESHCPDRSLAAIATALNHNDLPRARAQVETLLTAPAPSPLAQLLAAETFRRLEQPDLARQARRAYALPLATHLRNAPTLHRTPGATAAACAALDLPDLALKQLRDGIDESVFYPVGAMPDMADTYIAVAQILLARGHLDPMRQALELSIQIFAKPAAYNALARSAYFARDYSRAHTLWQRSLALDPAQADIRQALDQLTTPETPP